jgi:YesN/AraC family two-component response regulator
MGFAVIGTISNNTFYQIEADLNNVGFELIYDKASKTIEQIKIECRNYLTKLESQTLLTTLSEFLVARVGMNYSYLSKLFSSNEGKTIESFFLHLKLERIKHLLLETEYSLSEIAVILQYSSVQYLSSQFKKLEGKSVTEYLSGNKIA